jgi:hypothetical protein
LDDPSSHGFSQRDVKLREYFGGREVPNRPSSILEGGYFALMGSYQCYRQNFEVDTSGGSWYIPEYHRTIQAFETAFLLGYQAQLGRRLSIDFWGGLWARYTMHRWSSTKPQYGLLAFGRITPVGDLILRPVGSPCRAWVLAWGDFAIKALS